MVEGSQKTKTGLSISPWWGNMLELKDAYMSVREAVKHAALRQEVEAEIRWVHRQTWRKIRVGRGQDG